MDYFEDPTLCLICFGYHPLKYCKYFKTFTNLQRSYLVKVHKYCAKCFSKAHRSEECTLIDACAKCQGPHHVMLHQEADGDLEANTKCCESEPSCSNVLNMHRRMQRKRTYEPYSFERCSCQTYMPSCSHHTFGNICSCSSMSSRSYEDHEAGPSKRVRSCMPVQSCQKNETASQAPATLNHTCMSVHVPFTTTSTSCSWLDSSSTMSSRDHKSNTTFPALSNLAQPPPINPFEQCCNDRARPSSLTSPTNLERNSDYVNPGSLYTDSLRSISLSELNFETTSRTNSPSPTAESHIKNKQFNWRSCFSARRSRSPSIESDSEEEKEQTIQSSSHGSRRRSTILGPLSIEIPKDQASSQSSSSSNLISSSDRANFCEKATSSSEGSPATIYLYDSSSWDRKSMRSNYASSSQKKSLRNRSWGSQQENKVTPSHSAITTESTTLVLSERKGLPIQKCCHRKTTKICSNKDRLVSNTELPAQTGNECQKSQTSSDRRYTPSKMKMHEEPCKETLKSLITPENLHYKELSERCLQKVTGCSSKGKSTPKPKSSYKKMLATVPHQTSTEKCTAQQSSQNDKDFSSIHPVTRSRSRSTLQSLPIHQPQTIAKQLTQVNSPPKPGHILAAIQLILKDILAHLKRHKDNWLTPATRRRQTLLCRDMYQMKTQLSQLIQYIPNSKSNSQKFQRNIQQLQHLKMLLHQLRQPLKGCTAILSTRQLNASTHGLIEYLKNQNDRSKMYQNLLKQLQTLNLQSEASDRGKRVDLLQLKIRLRLILRTMLKSALDQLTKLLNL